MPVRLALFAALLLCAAALPLDAASTRAPLLGARTGVRTRPPLAAAPQLDILFSFDDPADGYGLTGPLLVDGSGAIYGTAMFGGGPGSGSGPGCANACGGAFFKLTPSPSGYVEQIVHHEEGSRSPDGLGEDARGNLYGTVWGGGRGKACGTNSGCGDVIEMTPDGATYRTTIVHNFAGGKGGRFPYSGVIADASGALYGTSAGGLGCSVAYKLIPDGARYRKEIVHRFADTNAQHACAPDPSLILDSSGSLYGVEPLGGTDGNGIVFALSRTGARYAYRVLHRFRGGHDGSGPSGSLIRDAMGNLYGVTSAGGNQGCRRGGSVGCGTAYALVPDGSRYREVILHRFHGGNDGAIPVGPLVAYRGRLFGETLEGGAGGGTIFALSRTPSGFVESIYYAFNRSYSDHPAGGLALANEALYGFSRHGNAKPGQSCYCENVYRLSLAEFGN